MNENLSASALSHCSMIVGLVVRMDMRSARDIRTCLVSLGVCV